MKEPNLPFLVAAVARLAMSEFNQEVDGREVEALLRQVLYEPRDLWGAVKAGLVTEQEVASAVSAHVQTWLMHKAGTSIEQQQDIHAWNKFADEVEAGLFGHG